MYAMFMASLLPGDIDNPGVVDKRMLDRISRGRERTAEAVLRRAI
jgi:hypothetical protein